VAHRPGLGPLPPRFWAFETAEILRGEDFSPTTLPPKWRATLITKFINPSNISLISYSGIISVTYFVTWSKHELHFGLFMTDTNNPICYIILISHVTLTQIRRTYNVPFTQTMELHKIQCIFSTCRLVSQCPLPFLSCSAYTYPQRQVVISYRYL